MEVLRARGSAIKADATRKTSRHGWVLEKQPMTFADEHSWSNRDTDVTPLERRTWTSWTVLGYWMSDALSAQSLAGASAIIAVGLTWYVTLLQPTRYSVTRTPNTNLRTLRTGERLCTVLY